MTESGNSLYGFAADGQSPTRKKYIELTEEDRAKDHFGLSQLAAGGVRRKPTRMFRNFAIPLLLRKSQEEALPFVPSRYIEFVNRDENIDFDTKMRTLQAELKELLVQEEKSKADLLAVFKELGYEIEL